MASLTREQAHRCAREKGPSRWLVRLFKLILIPFMRVWYGLRITGSEHIPSTGSAVIAPNHKSFYDAFFIAAATKRQVRFMGKSELFTGWHGRLLLRLGGFPVRRGESDADALETSRQILQQGGVLALFPEGTRVRDPDVLGVPKRGAARLAIETGSPLIPTAITGTQQLFIAGLPKPGRVQLAFGEPIAVTRLEATPDAAGELLGKDLWPKVEQEYSRLRSRPGLIAAGLAAAGLGVAAQQLRKRRR